MSQFSVGDVIRVQSKQVGGQVRIGTVLEILEKAPPRLRVRWEDDHESLFYPSGGMVQVVRLEDE
jgi:hypothetical protein